MIERRFRLALNLALSLVALALAVACGAGNQEQDAKLHRHVAIEDQECEVCGMSVAMQPAPRAQAVHRDGTRFFFCSIADWSMHVGAPSPHGRVVASFVEVVEAAGESAQPDTAPHAWVPAQDASYVLGIDRPGVMGEPVFTHRDAGAAESAWRDHPEARIVDLATLQASLKADSR
jgi:nitrous oxide reductase accessory protein NosL